MRKVVITVRKFMEDERGRLGLSLVAGANGLDKRITVVDVNRPGLALAGYFEHFAFERIQVMGRTEIAYIEQLDEATRTKILRRLCSFDIPCIIVSRNLRPPQALIEATEERRIPVLNSSMPTPKLISELSVYLDEIFAPETSLHGVLVEVYGIGVLILGESGVGKSECALELVERGHRLITDDVVDIKLISGKILVGSGNELIKHHMEIRGIGIIDIRMLFGAGSVRENKRIELVIALEEWRPDKEYDRIGTKEETFTILGVELPKITIPIRPGRNVSILVEIAALNQRLKMMGFHSAREFSNQLVARIGEKTAPSRMSEVEL
ncbi:MAG: HPr(Ser) kinase/phosphatase [bacterium]